MSGFGNYPDGFSGAAEATEVEIRCVNPECEEYGVIVFADGYSELGACYLVDEEPECEVCGGEME
jgi:hypothetical protein